MNNSLCRGSTRSASSFLYRSRSSPAVGPLLLRQLADFSSLKPSPVFEVRFLYFLLPTLFCCRTLSSILRGILSFPLPFHILGLSSQALQGHLRLPLKFFLQNRREILF